MAEKTYTIASPQGAERYGVGEGEEVTLDLDEEQELALFAAGWLEAKED